MRLLGKFEDGDSLYLVEEHCARGDLFQHLLQSGGTLPERQVAQQVRPCPHTCPRSLSGALRTALIGYAVDAVRAGGRAAAADAGGPA